MTRDIYYFGCWGKTSGHCMYTPLRRTVGHHESEKLRIPRDHDMDGGPLFLPHSEKVGDGALTYLPACDVTILAWWGNPWDGRGKVNTAVIARGVHDSDSLWAKFVEMFPTLAAELPRPTVVRE